LYDILAGQTYEATSVKDILDDKPNIRSTISIQSLILFRLQGANITLYDVNYERGEDDSHKLYDITGSMDVTMDWVLKRKKNKYSVPEGHLHQVDLFYMPSTDEFKLHEAKVEGPPSPEEETKLDNLEYKLLPRAEPS